MRIGITYDLKDPGRIRAAGFTPAAPPEPDDFQEEFDSPKTIDAIAAVLRRRGHDVAKLGDGRELLQQLLADPPDLVFNLAEGTGIARSREARVPAVCEMLGIPHTGSDPLTLAVTLDKDVARRLVQQAGIRVPQGLVVYPNRYLELEESGAIGAGFFPAIVKPAWEGSSKGIRNKSLVLKHHQLRKVVEEEWRDYRQPLLVEQFIDGEEITVGIIGNLKPRLAGGDVKPTVIGVMQVVPKNNPKHFIYGLEVKRDYKKLVEYVCPPRLPPEVVQEIEKTALRCYDVLGCRDVARVDFRVENGVPYFLEVNPLPGVNPDDSDLVILAKLCGWTYDDLIGRIVDEAIARYPGIAS